MPPGQFVTVVTLARFTRCRTEVLEIGRRALGVILVVAGSRAGAVFELTPGWGIALEEVFFAAVRAAGIARRENCSRMVASSAAVAFAPAISLQSAMSPAPTKTLSPAFAWGYACVPKELACAAEWGFHFAPTASRMSVAAAIMGNFRFGPKGITRPPIITANHEPALKRT